MKPTLSLLLLVLLPFLGTAQSDLSEEEVQELKSLQKDLKGTYQIQVIGSRAKPAIPLALYRTIDEKRDPEEVVYHEMSERMRVKILPEKQIQSSDFEGVEERIVHISEKEAER
jgi:hypothetical protein